MKKALLSTILFCGFATLTLAQSSIECKKTEAANKQLATNISMYTSTRLLIIIAVANQTVLSIQNQPLVIQFFLYKMSLDLSV